MPCSPGSSTRRRRLHDKYKPGTPYDPMRFYDPKGYLAMVERNEKAYLQKVQEDKQAIAKKAH